MFPYASITTRTVASAGRAQTLLFLRGTPRRAPRFTNSSRCPNGRRYQSSGSHGSSSTSSIDPTQTPFMAGVAGGLLVLTGGYIWYHVSGTASTLKAIKSKMDILDKAKSTIQNTVPSPPSPGAALNFIRSAANSYSGLLPAGTKEKMDNAFDMIDDIANGPKAKEINQLVQETYTELRGIFSEGGFDAETANRVRRVLEEKGKALKRLAGDAGQQILDTNPKLAEILRRTGAGEGALGEVAKAAKEAGPEAGNVLEDLYAQLNELLGKEGGTTDPAKLYKAASLIQSKSEEIRRIGRNATERAWDEAYSELMSQEGGLLDMLPEDVRTFLEDNVEGLKRAAFMGGGVGGVYEIVGMLRQYAGHGSGGDLKEYIEKKVKEAGVESGKKATETMGQVGSRGGTMSWDSSLKQTEEYLRSIPGGQQLLETIPGGAGVFVELARNKRPEAKRLVEETVGELAEVLRRRMEEARRMARDIGEEGGERMERQTQGKGGRK
ncbi:hypothetical protein BDZ91DRAFT_778668 [Kalaharituber pfeilii]|nr:hypothetical protein BDZ91DRAFT_778668 [Kalaharituber pfeilii]